MTLQPNKLRRLKNASSHESTIGLFSHSPGRHHPISRLRHVSEVCFSWETNPPSKICSTDPSSMSLPSSKMWSPPQLNQKSKLGHKQPPMPLRTYNSTASGILNETIKQKRSKAMDMRYHWLTDRVRQKQFDLYWRPGRENIADYHTKHHSAQHHKAMRRLILHQANSLQVLRGCVKLLPLPQPPWRARTDAQTNPRAQRVTQLRSVLAHIYAVARQNQITTTVP
jgi:hypothetical protein